MEVTSWEAREKRTGTRPAHISCSSFESTEEVDMGEEEREGGGEKWAQGWGGGGEKKSELYS